MAEEHNTASEAQQEPWKEIDFEDLPDRLQVALEELGIVELNIERIVLSKCDCCEDDYYTIGLVDGAPRPESCGRCGDPDCLEFSQWGDRSHPEYTEDSYILDLGEGPAGYICSSCNEELTSRYGRPDGTISLHVDGEKFEFWYLKSFLFDPEEKYNDLPEDIQDAIKEIVLDTDYVRHDAWRGANVAPNEADGFQNVMDGWHSSLESSRVSEFINGLNSETLDAPVIKVFTTGSNVCAVGVNVYVPGSKVDEFQMKYAEAGLPRAFGLEA